MPFIGGVGVKANGADVAFELVAAKARCGVAGVEGAVGVEKETAVAVEDLGSPSKTFELIILEWHPVEFEVDACDASFLFGKRAAVGLHEHAAAVLLGGVD